MGLLSRLFGSGTASRSLLADLADTYRAEAAQAEHLRAHAERARYPQVGSALRRLADVEERHAAWVRERLLTLGGALPAIDPTPPPGNSQWERAVALHHAAQAKRRRVVELVARWDPDEPEAVEVLRRIEQEDTPDLAVYEGVIMRSDPQAID